MSKLETKLQELPDAPHFTCVEASFKHGHATYRAGNKYALSDHPDISKKELFMFWRAGWISVEGWPTPPARNPDKIHELEVHDVKKQASVPAIGSA